MSDTTVTREWLRALPKTDLHIHLTGTIRPETFGELVRREGIELPDEPETIYANINSRASDLEIYRDAVIPPNVDYSGEGDGPFYSLLHTSLWVLQALQHPDDFTRVVYEAMEDAVTRSNTRYLEFSIDPVHPAHAHLGYRAIVEAYARGIDAARADFGVDARLIAALDRSRSGEEAEARIAEVVANPHPYVVGIGLDNNELLGPPERFVGAFRMARETGLKATAHASEHAPVAQNTITCIDDLGCSRIDHGYFILQDDAVVQRVVDEQIPFTNIYTTSRRAWRDWRRRSSAEMMRRGVKICLASDDPAMFPTTLQHEYEIAAFELGWTRDQLTQVARNGIDACWLDEDRKQDLRAELDRALA